MTNKAARRRLQQPQVPFSSLSCSPSLSLSLSFSFSALFELSSNVQPRQQGKSGTLQGSFALDRVRNPLPHQPRFSCPSCVGQNARSSAQCFWHIQVPSSFEHVLLVLLRCGHTFGTQARPPPPNVMAGVDLVRRFNSASVILPKRHSEPFNFSRTALPLRSGILAQQRLQLKLVARMSHLCPGCSSGMSSGSCTISAITCFNVLETVPGHCGLLAADLPMSAAGLDVFATVLTKNSVSMVEPFAPQICGTTCRKKSGCAFQLLHVPQRLLKEQGGDSKAWLQFLEAKLRQRKHPMRPRLSSRLMTSSTSAFMKWLRAASGPC